jgi:hypothetical protein
MAEIGLVDYFVMGEAVGIVATLLVSFYFSRKQMQKLSGDIETKVLSDLDEKITDLTQLTIEKPPLMSIVSNVESYQTEEIAFTYHLQRKVVSEHGKISALVIRKFCIDMGHYIPELSDGAKI